MSYIYVIIMLVKPIKVDAEKHTWGEILDNTEFYYMDSLF